MEEKPSVESVKAKPPVATTGGTEPDSRNLAMLAHILGIVTGFLGSLIIWILKKDMDPFVDRHGKEALNFQLTVLICQAILMLPSLCVFYIPTLAIYVVNIIFCILATVAANRGEDYRYPINIRIIK
ncbi:MAG: DUF4870 domain-containing protein [Pirellulaceae bacterium]|nr:DUF4870 domain-containing protein [Pirellulaceae bacterium]